MFELSEEETLMYSSDNSVKLTSHRIIYESEKGRQQIMLEDFESFQLKRDSIGAYGILFGFFLVFTLLIIYYKVEGYFESRKLFSMLNIGFLEYFWNDAGFIVLLLVLMVFYHFYRISKRNMVIINGKYNSFEFRVINFKAVSVQKMLNKLVEQSNKRKNL